MTPAGSIKKPRRWRRWLVRVALGLGALVVFGVVALWLRLVWEQAQGRKELAEVIAEIEETDPRWRWEEIQGDLAPVPDAENSLLVVKKVVDSFGAWKPAEMKVPDGQPVFDSEHPSNRRLDEQRLAVLRKELGEHEQIIALAATLKDYPRGRASIQLTPDYLSTLLPHAQPFREIAALLALDIERLLHAGETDRAAERIWAILCASSGLRGDHIIISQLVRLAVRIIAVFRIERLLGMRALSDEVCLVLMRHVAAERQENLLLASVRGERAGWHHLFDNIEQGRVALADVVWTGIGGGGQPDLGTKASAFLYSYRIPEDHAAMLRWYNRLCDIARMPMHEQATELEELDGQRKAARQTAMTQSLFAKRTIPRKGVLGKVER
jgi:hypothetical protein